MTTHLILVVAGALAALLLEGAKWEIIAVMLFMMLLIGISIIAILILLSLGASTYLVSHLLDFALGVWISLVARIFVADRPNTKL